MKCAACHNKMITKKEELDLRIKGKLYIVRNATFEECSACGEKVLSPKVSKDLFDKIKNRDFVEQDVKIPILDGTYG